MLDLLILFLFFLPLAKCCHLHFIRSCLVPSWSAQGNITASCLWKRGKRQVAVSSLPLQCIITTFLLSTLQSYGLMATRSSLLILLETGCFPLVLWSKLSADQACLAAAGPMHWTWGMLHLKTKGQDRRDSGLRWAYGNTGRTSASWTAW